MNRTEKDKLAKALASTKQGNTVTARQAVALVKRYTELIQAEVQKDE